MADDLEDVLKYLGAYLSWTDESKLLADWKEDCAHQRGYAEGFIGAFDRVVAEPPPDLRERYEKEIGSQFSGVAWFRGLCHRMREIYESELSDEMRERRANPERAFYEYLSAYMKMNDEPGFLILWRKDCRDRDYAADILYCFDWVIEHPPADLIEKYKEATGYVLNHVTPAKITPYSFDDYVAYFRSLRDQMRAIYDES